VSDVEDYLAARAVEYGTYVATQTIYYNGVGAYNVGYPVPVSNVEKYGYLEQGLVRELSDSEKSNADDPPRRVITVYCQGRQLRDGKWEHDAIDLAALVSNLRAEAERWEVDDRVVHQQMVHPADADAAPGMLHQQGHVTERAAIVCLLCTPHRNVTMGDRLGVGYTTMVARRAADSLGAGYRTKPERLETDRLTPSPDDQATSDPVLARTMRPDIALAIAGQPTPSATAALHEWLSHWADARSDTSGVSRLPLSGLGLMVGKSS